MKRATELLFVFLIVIISTFACSKDDDSTTNTGNGTTVVSDCETEDVLTQSSNTQIEAMRQAMLTFRSSLSESLLEESSNCLDDERFYLWHNTPGSRDGIKYGDLSETQLNNFKSLLQLFLSTEGYQKVNEITVLAEGFLNGINAGMWDPDNYYIDMFGGPDNTGSWGFQLDGHHCAINFLVHGDQVSMVPAFLAAEPTKGTYNGTSFDIFKDERDLALSLYSGFSTTENAAAVSTSGNLSLKVGPASSNGQPDPYRGNYDYSGFETGLKYSDMSSVTQANLILLMKEYVYNLNTAFADEWWAEVMANIDETYFVWLDNVDTPTATTQFYYRIYNPYLWVEYNMENPVGSGIENWNHVHSITRIPNNPSTDNGGDYGIFAQVINQGGVKFLAEHYSNAEHHQHSNFQFDYILETEKSQHSHSHEHGHSHPHKS